MCASMVNSGIDWNFIKISQSLNYSSFFNWYFIHIPFTAISVIFPKHCWKQEVLMVISVHP